MENEIKKKMNGIEKICLVGMIIGNSLFAYGFLSDNSKIMPYGLMLGIPSSIGYLYFLSSKKKNELEKQKNYFYKI